MATGIDEVGRGCLAGPLCVAAVTLTKKIDGLKDSKKLTRKKREELDKKIRSHSSYIKIVLIDNQYIDKHGISAALKKGFRDCVSDLDNNTEIIQDGKIDYLGEGYTNAITEIKADDKYPEVSAASIVAKVYRDKLMSLIDSIYPEYGFLKNMGYGTKEHIRAIAKYGNTPVHRISFKIKNFHETKP